MTMNHEIIRLLRLLLFCLDMTHAVACGLTRARIIITTDGEVDDMNGFIRLLHYANEFEIEGLVYSSSQWHYVGDGEGTLFTSRMPGTARRYGERTELRWTGTTWMQDLIDLYAKSYENLLQHKLDFPSPEHLKSLVRVGNIDFEGEMEKGTAAFENGASWGIMNQIRNQHWPFAFGIGQPDEGQNEREDRAAYETVRTLLGMP